MSSWSWRRTLLVLWRPGAAYTLFPLVILAPLKILQGIDTRIARYMEDVMVFLALAMVFSAWHSIAVRHVRVAVDACQLRVPGFPRVALASVAVLAVWTALAMCALWQPWPGMTVRWPQLIACAIGLGCLASLVDYRLLFALSLVPLASCLAGVDWMRAGGRAILHTAASTLDIVAAGLLLLIVWRLALLARALKRGSCPGFLDRSLHVARDDARLLGHARLLSGRVPRPRASASAAMRMMLGPLYEPHPAWRIWRLAALPVLLLLGSGVRAADLTGLIIIFVPLLGGWWFLIRAQRLAVLLQGPQGETVELALLPGLGSARQQRRALLTQALLGPVRQGGLCLAGIVGGYWAVLRITQLPPERVLNLMVPSAMAVVLFVSLSLGVFSGRLAPTHAWLRGWALVVLLPAGCSPLAGPSISLGYLDASPLTFWLTWWVAMLAVMAACMTADTLRLRRLPRLLCQ